HHREVVGDGAGRAALDRPEAGHHAVSRRGAAGHVRVVRVVGRVRADLDEALRVEEEGEPLPRRELAGRVLAGDRGSAAQLGRLGAPAVQLLDQLPHAHRERPPPPEGFTTRESPPRLLPGPSAPRRPGSPGPPPVAGLPPGSPSSWTPGSGSGRRPPP